LSQQSFPSFGNAVPGYPYSSESVNPPSYFRQEKKNIFFALLLLLICVLTATLAGYGWDVQFRFGLNGQVDFPGEFFSNPLIVFRGLPYAIALLFILLCHEMGHFLACRSHGIHCTPPFPIPFPAIPVLLQSFGTMGAFIKIKSPFLNRKQLFDVGFMGPLCGMVAAVPIFIAGVSLSGTTALQPEGETLIFGDSLLTWLGLNLTFPAGTAELVSLHPLGWAAFFGFLATSLNLLPIGQLDGGHIAYALLGRRGHRVVSLVTFAALIGISIYSWPFPSYLVFALILLLLRLRHPPTCFDDEGLDLPRKAMALLALVLFLVTFIPVPIRIEYF